MNQTRTKTKSRRHGVPNRKQLLKDLEERGAIVQKVDGENLFGVLGLYYKSDAWEVLEEWGKTVDIDPMVLITFYPPPNIANSSICPPDALGIPIMREANSIVHYYSTLRMEDFQENPFPPIGPPLGASPGLVRVNHATVALGKLMERIQNAPPDYPAINSLKSGSYVCNVVQSWANVVFEIIVMKR
jgi:hypothetical protein